MEDRVRVKDIKKRFEDLNFRTETRVKNNTLSLGCSLNNSISNESQNESQFKNQVKRTPAFRSVKYCVPNLKNQLEARNAELMKNFKKEDRIFLTDTLKTKLQAPLPKGPAPQKPPRTFAHSISSHNVLLTERPSFARSKTDPHIMLDKIETALRKNSFKPGIKPMPVPRPCTQAQRSTTHIYDTPCESNGSLPPSGRKSLELKVFQQCFNSCAKPEPLYTEPYKLKLNHKANTGQQFQPNLPQQSRTLHYMSTPIVSDGSKLNGIYPPTLYQDSLKAIKMKMLEPFNNNFKSETDSDGDSVKDIKHQIEERKIYAKRVASVKKITPRNKSSISPLVDAVLLIGIDNDVNNGHVAYIQSKFPKEAEVPDNFASLIFPDTDSWPINPPPKYLPKTSRHNNYTIFITSSDGVRSYAYCRRVQPEGSPVCLPLAYAILTSHKPNTIYYKILSLIESRHGIPQYEFNLFLKTLLLARFPLYNDIIMIGDIRLEQSPDVRQDSTDISTLLLTISVPIFISILSSLLLERKVILVSSYISLLSDCIEGLLKSLYPFEWQHTIISLLPVSMSEILQAPTPYVVGLLKSDRPLSSAFFSDIDDVIVVDIDKGSILRKSGDKGSVIPERLSKALKEALYLVPVQSSDIAPSESLIRLFVELIGHYNNHLISTAPDKNRHFQKETFIKAPQAKSVRLFLEWFTETALFHEFIQERTRRTNNIVFLGLFEQRCAEYVKEICTKDKTKSRALKTIKDWAMSSS